MKTIIITVLTALISLALQFGARADITTGLVGYWNLDEGSGSTATDSTANGNNGTLTSFADTTFTTMWTTNGWFTNAVTFNQNGESTNYIVVPDSSTIDSLTANKTYTLSAWVNCSVAGGSEPANAGIIAKGNLNAEAFALYVNGGHFAATFHNAADSGTETVNTTNAIAANTWYHVVETVVEPKGGGGANPLAEAIIYVNGVIASGTNSNTYTTLYSTNLPTVIGCRAGATGSITNAFKGTIDDVRIYNRGLMGSDVFQLYTNNAPAPVIATQPRNVTCYSNDPAQFSVVMNARIIMPISYQWQLNDTNISGATNSSLALTNVTSTNAGNYTVIVTNYMGSVTSEPAALAVQALPAPDISSGLVGWWKFDDASGSTTAADSSGNGNSGALTGFTDGTYTSMWGDGVIGGALSLNDDGTSSNLVAIPSVGTPSPAVLDFSTSPVFTLSAWVNASLTQSNEAAILARGNGNGGEQYVLELNGGKYRFFVRDANGVAFNITSAVALNGHWQHVAAVLNATNGNMNLYVNGALAGSAVAPYSLLATNHEVVIGNRQAGTAGYGDAFSGAIDDVRIYNRSLTSAEVFALYSAAAFPIITAQSPTTYTNLNTLYAGSSPTFKILSVTGLLPLSYQWFTNGVPDAAGTNSTYQLHNLSVGVITNYCVITNAIGSTTSFVWTASVIAAPTAPYPQAVLAGNPLGYWRLNEPDDTLGDYNAGVIADDYWGGNNGIYTNTDLGQPGYTANNVINTDPTETAAQFGFDAFTDGDAYGIGGINFGSPTNTSISFSVEAWVNGYPQTGDEGIVSLGYGNGGEQFDLDTGGPTNAMTSTPHNFRFLVRDAAGGVHSVSSVVAPTYGTWHHLVGVCDEVNSNVTFYVDGVAVGTATISPDSGILASTRQMVIGSRPSSSTTNANNLQFVGNVNDVAVYNYALSASQVAVHYTQAGVSPSFAATPPTNNVTVYALAPLTLPTTIIGTPPTGYQWYDSNDGTNVATGVTNGSLLNATLTISSVPQSWNGDTLQLTATNAYGTLNYSVALTVLISSPVISNNLPLSVTVPMGKSYTYSVNVGGAALNYQWYNGASLLAGQTNSTYSLTAGSLGNTTYYVIITNVFGAVTSSVSTFTSVAQLTNSYATNILSLGPVGYWPLQETNTPAPVTMETNYGTLGRQANAYYAATNANNVTFGQTGALTSSGDNDAAVLFQGTSSTGSITNINSYAFVPRTTPALTLRPPFTLECWVNSSDTGFGDILGEGGGTGLNAPSGSGNWGGARLSWGGSASGANIQFYVCNGNGTTRNSVSTPANSLSLGQWHHCVATYDGTNTAIYVDGSQLVYDTNALAGANTMAADTWSPFTIGGSFWQANGPARELFGSVDDVAVYTNVLTTNQVSNHYLAGITSSSNYMATVEGDQPLMYYRMDCAGYVTPDPATFPVAVNYGSATVNGAYVSGTVPGGVSGPTISVLGTNSLALPVNGVISCVDAGYDPSFNRMTGQPFTAMTWFKTYPCEGRVQTIMSHGANWAMNLDGTTGRVVWNIPAAGATQVTSTNVLNDGNWHFVAGVYDGSTSYLYVDGALNSSGVATGSQTSDASDLFLGGNAIYTQVGSGQRYFAGAIAQAAFYTNALSAVQIQQISSTGAPVTPTVSVAVSGHNVVLTYTGTLLSSTNVAGPYSPVGGASSPYNTPATNAQMFFRTQQ